MFRIERELSSYCGDLEKIFFDFAAAAATGGGYAPQEMGKVIAGKVFFPMCSLHQDVFAMTCEVNRRAMSRHWEEGAYGPPPASFEFRFSHQDWWELSWASTPWGDGPPTVVKLAKSGNTLTLSIEGEEPRVRRRGAACSPGEWQVARPGEYGGWVTEETIPSD